MYFVTTERSFENFDLRSPKVKVMDLLRGFDLPRYTGDLSTRDSGTRERRIRHILQC